MSVQPITQEPQAWEAPQPPHNIEAEQALLGALLVNNRALGKVADFLEPDHFFLPVHGRIYEAVRKLIDRGLIADPVTLRQYFERDDALVDVGGPQYLVKLANAAVTVIDAGHYGEVILDLAVKRELILTCEDAITTAYDGDVEETAQVQVEALSGRIFQLSAHSRGSGGFRPIDTWADDVLAATEASIKGDDNRTISTGLKDLDAKLGGGWKKGKFYLIGARPGQGKSGLMMTSARVAAKNGGVTCITSLEMTGFDLAQRTLSSLSGVPVNKIENGAELTQHDFDQLVHARSVLRDLPILIDDQPAQKPSQIRARVREIAAKHEIASLWVDYLQLARPDQEHATRHDLNVGAISGALVQIMKEFDIPVIALSQLNRSLEQRADKRPMNADLRESGSLEQDAHAILFLYRHEEYLKRQMPEDAGSQIAWEAEMDACRGQVEIIIGKQRNGPTGTVKAFFDAERIAFADLARQYQVAFA